MRQKRPKLKPNWRQIFGLSCPSFGSIYKYPFLPWCASWNWRQICDVWRDDFFILVTKGEKNQTNQWTDVFLKALMPGVVPAVWYASSNFKLQNKQAKNNFDLFFFFSPLITTPALLFDSNSLWLGRLFLNGTIVTFLSSSPEIFYSELSSLFSLFSVPLAPPLLPHPRLIT